MAHQGRFENQKQGEEDDAWHRLLIEPAFERTCLQKFGFLEKEFGFALRYSETTSQGSHVTYTNQTTGVRVSLEPREGGIFVELSRLADGELPSVPIFIESDSVLNSFDLDDILLLRSAPTGKQLDTSSALTADEIERELERYASALRAYAPDILWGDFELFPQLASLVKRRKRELDDSYEQQEKKGLLQSYQRTILYPATSQNSVIAKFAEFQKGEVRRIYLPRTGVKIVSAVALFHSFGVARQGPWVTWVNKDHKKGRDP